MSLYPIIWAAEHAPVRDAEERAILTALVIKGDFDGCNCYRSYPTLAAVARVDPKTAGRKCREMEKRGILRRQPGPKPEGWRKLPKDKRPVVWEVLIPFAFWSAVQLEEINLQRAERGRPPITPRNRPPIAEAPPKRARSDKGTPKPERRKPTERRDSQSPRSEESDGTLSPPAQGLQVPPPGDSQSPNPLLVPSDKPSSSYVTPAPPATDGTPMKEEEDAEQNKHQAYELVDAATARWDKQHRRPNANERHRIAEKVAEALAAGATPDGIIRELTRDLNPGQVATTAVQVVRFRIKEPGWAKQNQPPTKPTVLRPPWCGTCDERTRLIEDEDQSRRCPDCHPLAIAS